MIKISYSTTLYTASVTDEITTTRKVLRGNIFGFISEAMKEHKVTTVEYPSYGFVYNGTLIQFKVRDLNEAGIVLLSFFPHGENIETWYKAQNIKAAEDTINFCNLIGDDLRVRCSDKVFEFKRRFINDSDNIDTSDWEVYYPQKDPVEKEALSTFLNSTKTSKYDNIFSLAPKDNKFYIFTQSLLAEKMVLDILKSVCLDFGEVKDIQDLADAKTYVHKLEDKGNNIFILLEQGKVIKAWRNLLKNYFDTQHLPSQYITQNTVVDKLPKFRGVKANLVLEVMAKRGKPLVTLKPNEDFITSDGFLCLSDIESENQKIFGALFTYTQEQSSTEEEIQLYDDIDFISTKEMINFVDRQQLMKLCTRVINLIRKKIKIDLILTKEWSADNLKIFVESLSAQGINVDRVYYISTRTSRFTDEYILKPDINKNQYPYLFVGDKAAFIRTSTEVRIYHSLSGLFVKLCYPFNSKIELHDLEKTLWLVRKRIYRIQEFYVLKLPEPLYIFHALRDLVMEKREHIQTLPLRLLI